MTVGDAEMPTGFVRPSTERPSHELAPGRPLIIGATGADTGDSLGVIEEVVAPGDGPPLHIHHAADEFFYVLAGEFTWKIGDVRATAGVGSVAFVPRGVAHTWQNSGSETGRMLFVFTPAGFERFLMELSAVPPEARTVESINEMAAPYQTTYVGSPLAALAE